MKNGYEDIREKLGEPRWFDDYGVPRYCEFEPRRCGVYCLFVALVEIACQDCGQLFMVSKECDGRLRPAMLPMPESIGSFHYGDPPIHGCVGDTMNCETVRIAEFWWRDTMTDWQRDPSREITYESALVADPSKE